MINKKIIKIINEKLNTEYARLKWNLEVISQIEKIQKDTYLENKQKMYLIANIQEKFVYEIIHENDLNDYNITINFPKKDIIYYKASWDGKYGDFFIVDHDDGKVYYFDLKTSNGKNQNRVGSFGYDSLKQFKAKNHYYLCLSYTLNKACIIDSSKLDLKKDECFLDKDIKIYKKDTLEILWDNN